MSAPGQDREHPMEGPEHYVDLIDKLFAYPRTGLRPDQADAVASLEGYFEGLARDVVVLLRPCSDRSNVLRQLRQTYLLACDSIRLDGAV